MNGSHQTQARITGTFYCALMGLVDDLARDASSGNRHSDIHDSDLVAADSL